MQLTFSYYLKLDTLSKDDLIKFAKKQMAGMQKMKSRCAGSYKSVCVYVPPLGSVGQQCAHMWRHIPLSDLEKEVESLKQQSKNNDSSSADAILIQVWL